MIRSMADPASGTLGQVRSLCGYHKLTSDCTAGATSEFARSADTRDDIHRIVVIYKSVQCNLADVIVSARQLRVTYLN